MVPKKPCLPTLSAPAALLLGLVISGCSERDLDSLGPAPSPSSGEVYLDGFSPGLEYHAFGGSKVDALDIDETGGRAGTPSLKFTIPLPNDPAGGYAGGVFVGRPPRDLSVFTALTFWTRARQAATLNTVGFGNDNSGNSRFPAEAGDVTVSTTWSKVILPIPDPSKLSGEGGLFYLAEGAENNQGNEIWFDEVRFEDIRTIANPRPAIASADIAGEPGGTAQVMGTQITYDVAGEDRVMKASPAYFSFGSSDPGVVTVDADGKMTFIGLGTATVTASLGSVRAAGTVTVNVGAAPDGGPPAPARPAENVISLFSDVYDDVTVDTWSAEWDQADFEDVQLAGDNAKKYSNLAFAGIEFTSAPVDASDMSHFHFDLWTGDETAPPAAFRVKLVDFGADGSFGGDDDSEHEITLTAESGLASRTWVSFDVPLTDFAGLRARSSLAQLIISGDPNTIYLDNIYFWGEGAPPPPPPPPPGAMAPEEPAPAPERSADDVISLFSDAYEDVTVDTWSAEWDQADVEDIQVAGDNVKKYSNLVFAGIEFTSAPVDASAMTHFHLDVWTPDPTADPAALRVKLVDFGPNGVHDGGGDDSEHELSLTAASTTPLATGMWLSYDLAFEEMSGLAARASLAQLIISGDPNTIFVDNVYFWGESAPAPSEPPVAAPTPSVAAGDVISLFSDAYEDVTVDTWSAEWDQADVEDIQVAGDNVKKYSSLAFAGIEFTSAPVDASAMTHFHLDVWTPDPTADPAAFRVKLVDFGPNGVHDGGGDDSEHELSLTAASTPPLATGMWLSYDLAFEEMSGLAARASLAQLIISGDPNTIFVDNVYFWGERAPAPSEPPVAAPTPSVAAGDVISLFSDAYEDVAVDTWSADWDQGDVADVEVDGNAAKMYSNVAFVGVEFTSAPVDASEMTHFHIDLWTADETADPAAFRVKLVDFGANGVHDGGGDDSEHELSLTATSDPPLATGVWLSYDIPLADFSGLAETGHLAQLIFSGDLGAFWIDNVYFRRDQ